MPVTATDCLGRTLTRSLEIRCVSEDLTFSDASDIDKVFFFYKNKNILQEPLKSAVDKEISLQPAFYNYHIVSSQCVRASTATTLDDTTVASLTLIASQANVVSSTSTGSIWKIIKNPAFSLTSSTIVSIQYQLSRLGTTHMSDSLSLNIQMIDFSLQLPYFSGVPSTITVRTTTSFQFNPCNRLV